MAGTIDLEERLALAEEQQDGMEDRLSDVEDGVHGFRLRDYFAGQALAGLLANPDNDDNTLDETSSDAYRFADAMLKARLSERTKGEE